MLSIRHDKLGVTSVCKTLTPPSPFWRAPGHYVHALITAQDAAALSSTLDSNEKLRSLEDGCGSRISVRMPKWHKALYHFCGGRAFVKMSAACSLVSMYWTVIHGSSRHSFKEDRSCDSEKNTEHQNAHKVFSNLRRTRGDIQLSRHLMLGWEIVRTCLAKTLDEGTTGMKKNTMASCVLNGTNLFPTSFERKLKLA